MKLSVRVQAVAVLIASLIVQPTSLADVAPADGCWKHTLLPPATQNVLSLCIHGEKAGLSVYFPNEASEPTTCFQSGQVSSKVDGGLQIALKQGVCKNGNGLAGSLFDCRVTADMPLTCTRAGINGPMVFERISTDAQAPTSSRLAAEEGDIRKNGLDAYAGVRAWMPAVEVRTTFGEPGIIAPQRDGTVAWRYPSTVLFFDRPEGVVVSLVVMDTNAPRINGVGMGSTEAEVLAAIGNTVVPPARTRADGVTLRYGSDVRRLVFMLEHDRVRLIGLSWFRTAAEGRAEEGAPTVQPGLNDAGLR